MGLCLRSHFGWVARTPSPPVDSFSPQGEVRGVQQVAISFGQDMVALGQADTSAPVQLDCSPVMDVSRRWLDARRWVTEFKSGLPVGSRCTARLHSGLRSFSGGVVAASEPWLFSTGGPKVVWQHPRQGSPLSEQQVFLLSADVPLARASLQGALHCLVTDQARTPVVQLDIAETRAG